MFAVLAAVAFAIGALIASGAVAWPHLVAWFLLGMALIALHMAFAVSLPVLVRKRE